MACAPSGFHRLITGKRVSAPAPSDMITDINRQNVYCRKQKRKRNQSKIRLEMAKEGDKGVFFTKKLCRLRFFTFLCTLYRGMYSCRIDHIRYTHLLIFLFLITLKTDTRNYE